MKERIVHAALLLGDKVHVGPNHKAIRDQLETGIHIPIPGFTTDQGRFVGRIEGGLIAVVARQLSAKRLADNGGELTSEMLTLEET